MIGALILILVGGLLLLANFDLVSWSVFAELWRFWPLVLIFWGLQLIFGRNRPGRFVVVLVALMTTIYLGLSLVITASPMFRDWLGTDAMRYFPAMSSWADNNYTRTTQSVMPSTDANVSSRSVTFAIGAAEFDLTDTSTTSPVLAIDAPADALLDIESEVSSGVYELTAETPSRPWMFFRHQDWTYTATLGESALPTDVRLELGAGKATVDLANIQLNRLAVELGAGTVTATVRDSAVPAEASFEVGAGTVTLAVPSHVSVEITYDTGAGVIKVDGQTLRGSGTYLSAGRYAMPASDSGASVTTLKLDLTVGAGTVTVER